MTGRPRLSEVRRRSPYPDFDGSQACATMNPDLFFPLPDQPHPRSQVRAICALCPFLADCRAYALDRPTLAGWWGGMSQEDRRKVRQRRRERRAEGT